MNRLVLVEKVEPAMTVITLNRPDKRNALSIALMKELCAAIKKASSEKGQRVVVIQGAGEVFSAGLDLKEASDPKKVKESAEWVAKSLLAVHQCPLVTLALVHGVALAGGAGLMMACDFAIATYDAKIGFPEVRRGLVAGLIMTFLRRQLRERDTRELLLGGEIITSERAQELGIVNRVVPKEALMAKAHQIAESVIKGGPEAIALTKQILDELWHRSVQEDLKTALKHHVRARQSKEASEGIQAFLEKRAPEWQ